VFQSPRRDLATLGQTKSHVALRRREVFEFDAVLEAIPGFSQRAQGVIDESHQIGWRVSFKAFGDVLGHGRRRVEDLTAILEVALRRETPLNDSKDLALELVRQLPGKEFFVLIHSHRTDLECRPRAE
jgi:hypothetical protein